MSECRFCKIARELPPWAISHGGTSGIVSFKPFGAEHPQHRLFIPTRHIAGAEEEPATTGRLFAEAARWAKGKGHPFKLNVNSGAAAGQAVFHLHIHYVPYPDNQKGSQ